MVSLKRFACKTLIGLALILWWPLALAAQDATGDWFGVMDVGAASLGLHAPRRGC